MATMSGPKHNGHAAAAHASKEAGLADDVDEGADVEMSEEESNILATVATVGAVGVGVLVFEAALLPGMALGVVAMAAPKFLPRLGSALNPLFKSTVRGAYKIGQKTKEFVAETQEQVEDIVAEVDAETGHQAPENAHQAASKA
jgi:hypothetical protein